MGIKRGVSLYSYQQAQFFGQLDWKAQVREVSKLGTDGIEIIDEQLIRDYPFPSDEFVYDWNSYLARFGMKAVTMDIYLDVHQFRDHVLTRGEGVERLKNDIRIAAKLGFANVRCLSAVPVEMIEAALPTAEKYDVRIGKEIHAPIPIKPRGEVVGMMGRMDPNRVRLVDQILELRQRTGSKHVGLVPDMGIFQHSASRVWVEYLRRHAAKPEVIDFVLANLAKLGHEEVKRVADEKYPNHGLESPMLFHRLTWNKAPAEAEDIRDIIPAIISIHGKFYEMTEIPGKPGQYEDKCIDYDGVMRVLREGGYEGYINSEFEGQRDQQDQGLAGLCDEVEEVRRHHEMLARLSK